MKALLAIAPILCLAGCQAPNRIYLDQPLAPPGQQHLELFGGRTAWTTSPSGSRILLGYPLPGRQTGPDDFLIYIEAPAEEGSFDIAADTQRGAAGFLLQRVGLLAGKTEFTGGHVKLRRDLIRPNRLKVDLETRTSDGARVSGEVTATPNSYAFSEFDVRHAADVERLHPERPIPGGWDSGPEPEIETGREVSDEIEAASPIPAEES